MEGAAEWQSRRRRVRCLQQLVVEPERVELHRTPLFKFRGRKVDSHGVFKERCAVSVTCCTREAASLTYVSRLPASTVPCSTAPGITTLGKVCSVFLKHAEVGGWVWVWGGDLAELQHTRGLPLPREGRRGVDGRQAGHFLLYPPVRLPGVSPVAPPVSWPPDRSAAGPMPASHSASTASAAAARPS